MDAARGARPAMAAGPPGRVLIPGLLAGASPGVPGINRLVAFGFHHPVVSSRRYARIRAADGFVSAFPSGSTTVGTVRIPLDVDLGDLDPFPRKLALQPPTIAAPRGGVHHERL